MEPILKICPDCGAVMTTEAYPDPAKGVMVHKWLCCSCGKTELIAEIEN